MNPSGTQRPVMDVSAPRPSQSPASPVSSSSDQIAVRPAPLATAVTESPKTIEQQPQTQQPAPTAAKAKPNTPSEPAKQRSGAPVGVITAAVLVMMVLSAAAVIVYATSQTA